MLNLMDWTPDPIFFFPPLEQNVCCAPEFIHWRHHNKGSLCQAASTSTICSHLQLKRLMHLQRCPHQCATTSIQVHGEGILIFSTSF